MNNILILFQSLGMKLKDEIYIATIKTTKSKWTEPLQSVVDFLGTEVDSHILMTQ